MLIAVIKTEPGGNLLKQFRYEGSETSGTCQV
nr:MAG TPA: hypothetical protein [Caudoviricetes sp.]